jgi:TadE-like protein
MGVADILRARSGPRSPRSKGQSVAEFALVLPILALLLFGTIQFGLIFGANNGLINSVREAARFGSVCIGPTATCGPSTQTYLTGQKIPGSVIAYKGTPVATIEYQAYKDSLLMWNTRIRVSGCVTSIVFIPLIGNVLGLSDPSAFPLKSVETFRVEGQPSLTAPAGIAQDPSWTVAAAGGC